MLFSVPGARSTEAIQLRYLQTLTEVAGDRGSTIVFPMPTTLFEALMGRTTGGSGSG
jgi:hypothetical protein